ncbi:MAG: helix-turn-helix domain-containing protein [Bacillales bacterium]|nr:helix-turn-helix domain-containing protein [Bacillales bacterium]
MLEMDISIYKLAKLTNISRPTLYKYLDLYEKNEVYKMPFQFVVLFDFIKKNNKFETIVEYCLINFIS